MSFYPRKWEVIHITKKRSPIIYAYKVHQSTLQSVKSGKYLCVNLANNLSWNIQTESTIKIANNSLSFLRRNITNFPQDIKARAYKTLVKPILEYAGTVWDPHTATNINQLEAVQMRAARFVKGNYKTTSSTTAMMADLGWPTLQHRRSNAKLVMVYRITHSLIAIPAAQSSTPWHLVAMATDTDFISHSAEQKPWSFPLYLRPTACGTILQST
jgi:hypothetical protein